MESLLNKQGQKPKSSPHPCDFAAGLLPEAPSAVTFIYALPDAQPQYEVWSDVNVEQHEECSTSLGPPPPLTALAAECSTPEDFMDRLMSFSPDMCDRLENATREQHNNGDWRKQRIGRITASVAHEVLNKVKHEGRNTTGLVRKIMGEVEVNENLLAMKYGQLTEPQAADAYLLSEACKYKNLQVSDCGLFVQSDCAILGASPDRLVSCTCCGLGQLEIKCPFSCINKPATPEHIQCLALLDG